MQAALSVELSFCVVNTEQRGLLRYCLDAIARERATVDFETEVLVLDNASQDGSAAAARAHPVDHRGDRAAGAPRAKAANDSELLQRARGRFCLLLNEDSELEPGATAALHAALASDARAGAAGAMLVRPDGEQQPSAWRFPSAGTRPDDGAVPAQQLVVQSSGERRAARSTGCSRPRCSCGARRRRRSASSTRSFFVYSDEVDFCRRLRRRGLAHRSTSRVRAPSTTSSSRPAPCPTRRIVEFSRNRDRYMRKHHSAASAALVRCLTAWAYALRAAAALVLPGHDPSATPSTSRRRCFPTAARGCARAPAEFNRRLRPGRARAEQAARGRSSSPGAEEPRRVQRAAGSPPARPRG